MKSIKLVGTFLKTDNSKTIDFLLSEVKLGHKKTDTL